jgi:hypothetical protein
VRGWTVGVGTSCESARSLFGRAVARELLGRNPGMKLVARFIDT